jgi:hypothetical protein
LLFIVDVLIESSPGSLSVPDLNGDLPLHVAILSSSEDDSTVELVTKLLDRCPQSIREAGAGGNLPLQLAVSMISPSLPLVRLLVERWHESLDVRDAEGNVPLVLAAANKSVSLDLIYWLARAKPELIALHREGRGQKRCRGRLPDGAIDVEVVEESEAAAAADAARPPQRSTAYSVAVRDDAAGPSPRREPDPEARTDFRH